MDIVQYVCILCIMYYYIQFLMDYLYASIMILVHDVNDIIQFNLHDDFLLASI